MKTNQLPAAFSFLLPGLGQVYQRRLPWAALFFSAFTAMTFFPQGRYLMPLVALVASFEAFRIERKKQLPFAAPTFKERARIFVFSTVGMLGFFGWMIGISPSFLPVGPMMEAQDSMAVVAKQIRRCAKELNRYPEHLEECPAARLADRWGRDFLYLLTPRGFEIRSRGRDGEAGTPDDYHLGFRK